MKALDVNTTRDLEDLCINTIYASLVSGKLSPHTQTFQITSCTSRDLSPSTHDYPGMIATLTQWSTQCDLILAEIADRIRDVRTNAAEMRHADEEYDRELENVKRSVTSGKKSYKSKHIQGGAGSRGHTEDWDAELMQDVEEASFSRPAGKSGPGGGESPSGRKRKLVRPLLP
jgi:COP9 signalosome complex subunit 7